MEYLDEQLLEVKKQQRKSWHQTLETGFYIQDQLVEFDWVTLEPISLSLMLPTTFVTMPQSMVQVKYQSVNRPQIIKTSLDTSVNFTFSLLPHRVVPNQLRSLTKQLQSIIQRTNPANVFYDIQEEETCGEIPVCWFDYKGYAVDEQIYYMMYVLPWKEDQMLHGTFNCVFHCMDEWKKAARQVILSIKEASDV